MKKRTLLSRNLIRIISLCTALFILASIMSLSACAETLPETDERGWIDFFLMCNEGMKNDVGNVGQTLMVVSMNPETGLIKLLPFTWDTFIDYKGYDVPQRLDMPYRNNGAEETMKVFNENFNMDIQLFMSLNYLNLASLIDAYGGVTVDVSRAERNALNGMVASKKENIQSKADMGMLSQLLMEMLAQDYYLTEYGPDTHLNGFQAVGYGWLQYDSVYNCCLRDVKVIAALFSSVGKTIGEDIVLYTNESGYPQNVNGRTPINLDEMTEEDREYFRTEMAPIFQMAYHNLSEENIQDISDALLKVAYKASRQGVNIFDSIKYKILPLEAKDPYDIIGGTKGHIVDKKANEEAIKQFLFAEKEFFTEDEE